MHTHDKFRWVFASLVWLMAPWSSMIAAPLVLDLNESSVAVWNAQVIGSVFVLSALLEFYDHWTGHNVQ